MSKLKQKIKVLIFLLFHLISMSISRIFIFNIYSLNRFLSLFLIYDYIYIKIYIKFFLKKKEKKII